MRVHPSLSRGGSFVFALLVLLAAPVTAQVDTGTILGTVKDQSGAILPGATVTITHEGQGFTLSAATREDGTYIFTPIRSGAYSIEVEFQGFKKGIRRGISVAIQDQTVVDFTLQAGGVAEEVVVTAESPLLQTGTGTVGETLKSSTIENIPVSGRDYTVLARLVAGVVPPQPGARAPLMFSANGVRPAQNNYLLDGIDNNTSNVDFLSGVAYIVKPPIDAVDEIKILTSAFSAEYGRAGGAVLNTTLKSGSNQLRGSGVGVLSQRCDERQRLLREPRRPQAGRVSVESVRVHRRRPGDWHQDLLVCRLRGQPEQAGAHVGHDGADGTRTGEQLHRLLRPDRAADRDGWRRRPRAQLSARHDLRPGHDAADAGGPDRSGDGTHGHDVRFRARSVRQQPDSGGAARSERAAADAALSRREPGRLEQQLHRQSAQHRRHARVRHAGRSQFQRERSLLCALQLLRQSQDPPIAVRRRRRWRRVRRG